MQPSDMADNPHEGISRRPTDRYGGLKVVEDDSSKFTKRGFWYGFLFSLRFEFEPATNAMALPDGEGRRRDGNSRLRTALQGLEKQGRI